MSEWIKVFAPASVANIGPGFDVLGFAIEGIGDIVKVKKIPEKKIKISKINGDGGLLPLNPEENTAGIAAKEVLKRLKNFTLKKKRDRLDMLKSIRYSIQALQRSLMGWWQWATSPEMMANFRPKELQEIDRTIMEFTRTFIEYDVKMTEYGSKFTKRGAVEDRKGRIVV